MDAGFRRDARRRVRLRQRNTRREKAMALWRARGYRVGFERDGGR